MRIGFITTQNPDDPDFVSETVSAMQRSLATRSEVIPLVSRGTQSHSIQAPRPTSLRRLLSRLTGRSSRAALTAEVLDRSRREAQDLERIILRGDFDALLGCAAESPLYALETDLPIVAFRETTTLYSHEAHPEAAQELERGTLARVSAAIYPTRRALASAEHDLGLAPERGHVVPIGCHFTAAETLGSPVYPPCRSDLRLVIAASDSERSRLDLVVDVVEALGDRGWNVRLYAFAPPTAKSEASAYVTCFGAMRPSDPCDHARFRKILARAHWMLLPSSDEFFDVTPAEAALCGVPSIVGDTGSLPEVVVAGETGLVMPAEAETADYVRTIEAASHDPEGYRELSAQGRKRAARELTWEAWARRTRSIIESVVAAPVRG